MKFNSLYKTALIELNSLSDFKKEWSYKELIQAFTEGDFRFFLFIVIDNRWIDSSCDFCYKFGRSLRYLLLDPTTVLFFNIENFEMATPIPNTYLNVCFRISLFFANLWLDLSSGKHLMICFQILYDGTPEILSTKISSNTNTNTWTVVLKINQIFRRLCHLRSLTKIALQH